MRWRRASTDAVDAVEKKYEFDGPKGKVSLLDLFEGRLH